MELKEILELVQAVSNSALIHFQYEAKDGTKLSMEKGSDGVQPTVAAKPVEVLPSIQKEAEGKLLCSPLVGTFYAAPAEGAEAYVKLGDTVQKGQVLAIVEAMKLMNEIESEYDGVVEEILVENGQMVEYGQPLFRIA